MEGELLRGQVHRQFDIELTWSQPAAEPEGRGEPKGEAVGRYAVSAGLGDVISIAIARPKAQDLSAEQP
jgi:hypothetical protein